MNAFKKTLVAIAAVATLGGLGPPRLPPDITTATDMVDMVAGMATASPPTATTAIPPTTAIPRTATATSPTATATAAAEGWLVPRAGVVGYRPCVSCGRIRSAAPRRSCRRGAILFMQAKSRQIPRLIASAAVASGTTKPARAARTGMTARCGSISISHAASSCRAAISASPVRSPLRRRDFGGSDEDLMFLVTLVRNQTGAGARKGAL